jgi:hypothetical protein
MGRRTRNGEVCGTAAARWSRRVVIRKRLSENGNKRLSIRSIPGYGDWENGKESAETTSYCGGAMVVILKDVRTRLMGVSR